MNFWNDVRLAARSLARRPGFTLIAVATLALGIGSASAVFTLVNAVILRPLPYRDPDRLAAIWEKRRAEGTRMNGVTVADYLDYVARNRVFSFVTAHNFEHYNLTGVGEPERVGGMQATSNLLETYGVAPILGRGFLPGDDEADRKVLILSYGLWQRRFGGVRSVVGQTLRLEGEPYKIIGVMPATFQVFFGVAVELYVPLHFTPERRHNRGSHDLLLTGRLRDGISQEQAASDFDRLSTEIEREDPLDNTGHSANVNPLERQVRGAIAPALRALGGAVFLVVLIACANVASLLLARGTGRQREFAIRRALGASRVGLLRVLAAESLILATAGCAAGIAAAWLALSALRDLLPRKSGIVLLPGMDHVTIDARVLGFAVLIAAATALLSGMAPAWSLLRDRSLQPASRRSLGSAHGARLRGYLVAGETALATMLLTGAVLLSLSFARLLKVPVGFETASRLVIEMSPPPSRYAKPEDKTRFADRLLERATGVPGVAEAAISTDIPGNVDFSRTGFQVEGRAKPRTLEEWPKGHPRRVSWNFTHAMGVPVERGRAFTARDTAGQPLVMLINRDAADLYWPGLDPIGRRIALPFTNEWRTIVGITGNIRHLGLAKGDAPEIYFPLAQWAEPGMDLTLIVRTEGDPLRLAEPLRREIAALDPDLPVSGISTVASRIEQQASEPRFNSLLFGILAGLAISLSAIGLYSLLAYLVAQRTAEIGLRMALGARPGNVLRAVVRDGMQWTLAGIVAGIAAALALGRWLQPLLFGISTGDPWVYAGAATVLAAVALLACLVPALRASRVDPAIALRSE